MVDQVYTTLFLCSGNSARSIMAEAILNKDGSGLFLARSAGTQPHSEISPHTIDVLNAFGYPTSALCPKPWTEFHKPGAVDLDFVFTVCDEAAGETCPVWPGQPVTAHWGIPDPAAVVGSPAEIAVSFDDTFRMLKRRIDLLLALPIAKLDRLALTSHLQDIGRGEGATAQARA